MSTYQMTEMPVNHQLERFRSTCSVTSDHRSSCHDRAHMRGVRIKTFCSDLQSVMRLGFLPQRQYTYAICQILSSENTAEALIIVYDQDAVGPLSSTELTGLGHSDVFRDGQRGTRLQCSNSTLLYIGFVATSATGTIRR